MDFLLTPDRVLQDPELALLAVLRTALHSAEALLVAAHPGHLCTDDPSKDYVFPGSFAVSGTLLTLMRALVGQIELYSRLAEEERQRAWTDKSADF